MRDTQAPRHIYTVMADYGVGEFLWYRRGIDPDGPVANMGSLMDSCESKGTVSDALWKELRTWAEWYMDSTRNIDWAKGVPEIEWDRFNAEGLRLARKLREECGREIKVEYCRAHDDPYRGSDRRVEIPFAGLASDKDRP